MLNNPAGIISLEDIPLVKKAESIENETQACGFSDSWVLSGWDVRDDAQ